jgi:hypothetical protein
MATHPPQNLANHAHQPTLTNVAGLLGLLAFLLLLVTLVRTPSLHNGALLALAASVMTLVAISRVYTVRLQDRIILLEMRLRLERLGRAAATGALSTKQLTALRFASDTELPALIDRTLAEGLAPKQIKAAVTDWQADWMRT